IRSSSLIPIRLCSIRGPRHPSLPLRPEETASPLSILRWKHSADPKPNKVVTDGCRAHDPRTANNLGTTCDFTAILAVRLHRVPLSGYVMSAIAGSFRGSFRCPGTGRKQGLLPWLIHA